MLEGTCLCGSVRWTLKDIPQSATACSCTACRRYGTLWAYGWEGEDITFSGPTTAFVRGDSLSFNFCPTCGNASHWRGLNVNEQGRRRVAVNLRLTEPGPIVQALGLTSIGLHVFGRNAGAQALNRSLGYQVTSINMLKHLQKR